MTTVPTRHAWAAALAAAAALTLGGCAGISGGTPEEQVTRLAQKRWEALIKRDFNAAYEYLQPGYRAVRSADAYKNSFGSAGQWLSAEVNAATCEPERCTVKVRLVTKNFAPQTMRSLPQITTVVDETWVRDEGNWWFYESP
jgi:hypothetical protein